MITDRPRHRVDKKNIITSIVVFFVDDDVIIFFQEQFLMFQSKVNGILML